MAALHEGEVRVLKSEYEEDYLAIPIEAALIAYWRGKLADQLSTDDMKQMLLNREKRDRGGNHITIVPPQLYGKMSESERNGIAGKKISYALLALGGIIRPDAATYFVTVDSPHATFIRQQAGLGPHDFHVTLGFAPNDIHDHPKDRTTWLN